MIYKREINKKIPALTLELQVQKILSSLGNILFSHVGMSSNANPKLCQDDKKSAQEDIYREENSNRHHIKRKKILLVIIG